MEDKKAKTKGIIKKVIDDYGAIILMLGVSYGVGVLLGTKAYKEGYNDGFDAVCNGIVSASSSNGGLLLAHDKKGDYIFKATKVLND